MLQPCLAQRVQQALRVPQVRLVQQVHKESKAQRVQLVHKVRLVRMVALPVYSITTQTPHQLQVTLVLATYAGTTALKSTLQRCSSTI
jgi:hypothetical protein